MQKKLLPILSKQLILQLFDFLNTKNTFYNKTEEQK